MLHLVLILGVVLVIRALALRGRGWRLGMGGRPVGRVSIVGTDPFVWMAVLVMTGVAMAQRRGFGRRPTGDFESARTAREIPQDHDVTPVWTNAPGFERDVFTFARIKRESVPVGGFGRSFPWSTDAPDSDLNLSWRLQQLTAMRVDPDGVFLRLTDPSLPDFPMIYMVEPGSLSLGEEEVEALRGYLLNGGFLWLDDFWGDAAWEHVEAVMGRVFGDRRFTELPLSHPLYRCVFQIRTKGQVPNVRTGTQSESTGVTWETFHDGDTRTVHHRVIVDDAGRIMVLATHNTDNGDGWEWEGDNPYYFKHFSEKISYPLAVNVLFYVMTH